MWRWKIHRAIVVATSCVALASCQTGNAASDAANLANICNAGLTASVQTVVDTNGASSSGNVTAIPNFAAQTWATAVFVPRVDFLPLASDVCGNLHPRYCERSARLENVSGAARVAANQPNALAEAERIADDNCEASARQFVQDRVASVQPPPIVRCVKQASAICAFDQVSLPTTALRGVVVER